MRSAPYSEFTTVQSKSFPSLHVVRASTYDLQTRKTHPTHTLAHELGSLVSPNLRSLKGSSGRSITHHTRLNMLASNTSSLISRMFAVERAILRLLWAMRSLSIVCCRWVTLVVNDFASPPQLYDAETSPGYSNAFFITTVNFLHLVCARYTCFANTSRFEVHHESLNQAPLRYTVVLIAYDIPHAPIVDRSLMTLICGLILVYRIRLPYGNTRDFRPCVLHLVD